MLFIIMIAFIFISEYAIKRYMDRVLTLKERRPLANGRIILKKYYNTGAAGNLLSHDPKLMQCIHIAALGFVSFVLLLIPRKDAFAAKMGLSFMLGGGCSNLYDRLAKGHVVDYISFGFGPKRFRRLVFNLSDFFIFAGIILCIVQMLVCNKDAGSIQIFKKEGAS